MTELARLTVFYSQFRKGDKKWEDIEPYFNELYHPDALIIGKTKKCDYDSWKLWCMESAKAGVRMELEKIVKVSSSPRNKKSRLSSSSTTLPRSNSTPNSKSPPSKWRSFSFSSMSFSSSKGGGLDGGGGSNDVAIEDDSGLDEGIVGTSGDASVRTNETNRSSSDDDKDATDAADLDNGDDKGDSNKNDNRSISSNDKKAHGNSSIGTDRRFKVLHSLAITFPGSKLKMHQTSLCTFHENGQLIRSEPADPISLYDRLMNFALGSTMRPVPIKEKKSKQPAKQLPNEDDKDEVVILQEKKDAFGEDEDDDLQELRSQPPPTSPSALSSMSDIPCHQTI